MVSFGGIKVLVGLRGSEFEGVCEYIYKIFVGLSPSLRRFVKFCGRIDLKNIMVICVLQLFT